MAVLTKSVTVEEMATYCDVCGQKVAVQPLRKLEDYQCDYCGRDVCPACLKYWASDPVTDDFLDDYGHGIILCRPCDELVKSHKEALAWMRARHSAEVQEWCKRLKLECETKWVCEQNDRKQGEM